MAKYLLQINREVQFMFCQDYLPSVLISYFIALQSFLLMSSVYRDEESFLLFTFHIFLEVYLSLTFGNFHFILPFLDPLESIFFVLNHFCHFVNVLGFACGYLFN